MMDRQKLLNSLCEIEDSARAYRNSLPDDNPTDLRARKVFHLICSLTKIVREEIA